MISRWTLKPLHSKKQGMKENREIEKDAAILNVVEVVLNGFMDDEPAITAKLPEPGQTLGDGQPAAFSEV